MSAVRRWSERIEPLALIVDIPVAADFSLSETCGPVAWGGSRWPNMEWVDGCLIWIDASGTRPVPAVIWQPGPAILHLATDSVADAERLVPHLTRILSLDRTTPTFDDPVIASLASRYPGLRPFSYGSLYLGVLTSIVGQGISIASAATAQRRLAALFADPITLAGREFWPLPDAAALAEATPELVRTSGVTMRRAEALVAMARVAAENRLPDADTAWAYDDAAARIVRLSSLPLVGPWTSRSALLWGLAEPTVWPSGDAGLLRAVRRAYDQPDLTMRDLPRVAEGWQPAAGWATHLVWTGLFGPAPATISPGEPRDR